MLHTLMLKTNMFLFSNPNEKLIISFIVRLKMKQTSLTNTVFNASSLSVYNQISDGNYKFAFQTK